MGNVCCSGYKSSTSERRRRKEFVEEELPRRIPRKKKSRTLSVERDLVDARIVKSKMEQNNCDNNNNNACSKTTSPSSSVVSVAPQQENGYEFLKKLVQVILDEWKIVGDGNFMKNQHKHFINFKYPEEVEKTFDFRMHQNPETHAALLDICRRTIAFSIKSNHPHYMNSLYGGVDQYGIGGSWLTDALNSSAAIWESSPVFSIVEKNILQFLGEFAGLKPCEGHFCPGGSMANCYAMMLARHKFFADSKNTGLFGRPRMVCFVSDMAHYSFRKMAIMLGFGLASVIKVKTDIDGRMIPSELEAAILKVKEEGGIPFFVSATVGTTVYGAFDRMRPLYMITSKHQIWLHADGALGGTWLFSRKHRRLLDGLELCDSFTWDLHKMPSVPIYCSVILTRHPGLFKEAFGLNAEYLFQAEKYYNKAYDVGDFSIQCTRKVDAFKLYLFLKAHGLKHMEEYVDNVYDMSRYFEQQISTRKNFRLVRPTFDSSTICFFFIPDAYVDIFEAITPRMHAKICTELKRKLLESGMLMIAYQAIPEKNIPFCFRMSITGLPVYTQEDIMFAIEQMEIHGKNMVVNVQ